MLVDTLQLLSSAVLQNATIDSGATLPTSAKIGQLYYLTVAPIGLHVYSGGAWVHIAPTSLSQLTNDAGFITAAAVPTKVSQLTNDSNFITASIVPTRTSQLTNDSSFISSTTASNTFAPLVSPNLTGTPTVPTATAGASTGQAANTQFVTTAIAAAVAQLVTGLNYAGVWNASTNTPHLASGTGTKGTMYKVSVAGTTTLDGVSTWSVNDLLLYDGTTWDKIDGQPTQVTTFNNRSGAITLTSSDISTALGFAPVNPNVLPNYATLASPTFTGNVIVPTAAANDNSGAAASTAYVQRAIAGLSTGGGGADNIYSYFPGNLIPTLGTLRYYPQNTITLSQISLFCNTAPTTAIVVDLKKNGVSLFGSGSKPSISAGQNVSGTVTIPGTVSVTSSDYLTIDIDAGNGADMTARIDLA